MNDQDMDAEIESEESSPSQEAQQPASEPVQEAAPAEVEREKPELPFHEHPRFREVIEQKNQFAKELRQAQLAAERMQGQLDLLTKQREPGPQKNPMLERLEGIDPEFAKYISNLEERAARVEALKADIDEIKGHRQTQEAKSTYDQAMTEVSRLHAEHKVPKELQEFYQARVERAAAQNPELKVSDLPHVYKRIHEEFNSYLEASKRQNLAGYVQDKAKDARAPSTQPKGKSVGTSKPEYSKNPSEARAQLIQNVLNQTRGAKDI